MPTMSVMSPAMVAVRPTVAVGARRVADNDHVSELIDVSVAAVLIDENHLPVPMAIVA